MKATKTTKTKPVKTNYIEEECITKLKETALELERMMRMLDAMSTFGYEILGWPSDHNEPANKFFEGLAKMKSGVHEKMCRNMADCFLFAGISDGIRDLANEKLEEHFLKYDVSQFLDKWGNLPNTWRQSDEDLLKAEVKEKLTTAKKTKASKTA